MIDAPLLEARKNLPVLQTAEERAPTDKQSPKPERFSLAVSKIENSSEAEREKNERAESVKQEAAKIDIHRTTNLGSELENKSSSDKPFNNKKEDISMLDSFFKILHKVEGLSTYAAIGFNFLGAVLMQLNISDNTKRFLSKIVDNITNSSFIPYGFDGMRIGLKEKNNVYQSFGYFLETSTVWLSDIKTKYLIRGAGTGTDQIWMATDAKLEEKYGIKEGRFDNWYEGLIKVPLVCLELLQEVYKDPIGTIFTKESKGHKALLSSIGDIIATGGYALGGNEKLFGSIRDFAGALFDIELIFSKEMIKKLAGGLFIGESSLDFIARFAKTEWSKLTLNMLAHASGRAALMCYKNSDPNANKDKEHLLDFKSIKPDKKFNTNAVLVA